MRVLLRNYQQQGDQRLATDRVLSTDRLLIGRGTDQDLQIPDIRAALAHADIVPDRRGPLLQAKSGNGVWLNGAPVESALLEEGDIIDIGRFRLTLLEAAEDIDLRLGIEERLSQSGDLEERKAAFRMRLDQTGFSPRRNAWLLLIVVLACTLLIPLGWRYGVTPSSSPQQKIQHPLDDSIWSPGTVSSVHRVFADDCAACHVKPFEPVQNAACQSCHKSIRQHTDNPKAMVHHALAGAQCTDCHKEHHGAAAITAISPQLCTSCHANPDRQFAELKLLPAAGFGSLHPEFAPRIAHYDPSTQKFSIDKQRQPMKTLREDSNLIYPHDLHLNPKGIDSPQGKQVMKCADCHQPDATGVGFAPVKMEQHCASCHRLDFDPDDPDRVLPHGRPSQIPGIIRDYYASKALQGGVRDARAPAVVQARRRPGEQLDRAASRAALDWAESRTQQTLIEVFERRTCHTCHTLTRSGDPAQPWQIAPVFLQEHALNHARFSHAAHRGEACDSCHDAQHSKTSADVLLPDLKSCRSCHGDAGAQSKVPSDCVMCHAFHTAETPWIGVSEKPSP